MDIINRLEAIHMQLRGLSGLCSVMADAFLEGANVLGEDYGNGAWMIAHLLEDQQKNVEKVIDTLHQQERGGAA